MRFVSLTTSYEVWACSGEMAIFLPVFRKLNTGYQSYGLFISRLNIFRFRVPDHTQLFTHTHLG